MSQSIRPGLALAVLLAAGLLVGALMLRESPQATRSSNLATKGETDAHITDVRTGRLSTRKGRHEKFDSGELKQTSATRERTSGVVAIALQTPSVLPRLTGYIVDRFADWKTIEPGYRADGIVVSGGAITLAGDSNSTAPRFGVLVSPPIPLSAPALAGAVNNNDPLPGGAFVQMEISLSEDGVDWSPWVALERHRPPDGQLVSGPMQPSLANGDVGMADDGSSTPVTGPSLRYRLHLSAGGVASPSIRDVRIWKREYQ